MCGRYMLGFDDRWMRMTKKERKVKVTLKLLAWPLEWRVNVGTDVKNP